MLNVHGVTHEGAVRKSNEDSMLSDPRLGLSVVADGMGGHSAGEVASQLAVETMHTFLQRSHVDEGFTWPFGIDTTLSYNANRLLTAIKLANRRVFKASESRPDYAGMGTTVVATIVEGDMLTFANVGDSRIYSYLNGTLQQLTADDSWVATMLAQDKSLTPEALQNHPLRHVLTKAVGTLREADVTVGERRLRDREVLLLCSDGLHDCVSDEQMAGLLAKNMPTGVQDAAASLLKAALDVGARDNVTAVVVEFVVPKSTSEA
ncbi:MAG: protein phosphatase 2C domain-containing protein [Vicinamibacterales bacterium]